MKLIFNLNIIIIIFILIFGVSCKSDSSKASRSNFIDKTSITTCDELIKLVVDDGDKIQSLDASDMNSSALDYIALYEYDGSYYTIVEFTSSSKKYIYCDINKSDWNNFISNDQDSYGGSFHTYLSNSTCSCSR
ncbi:MAG: hypothetical protein KA536_00140 [Saprospiraceae bacterium]|nr:hypothetical protein [Saprospiraceae bacterium]